MLLFCLSPFAGFSLSAVAFVAGLLWHKQHQLPEVVDPEDAVRDLTMRLRQPVRYHMTRWFR